MAPLLFLALAPGHVAVSSSAEAFSTRQRIGLFLGPAWLNPVFVGLILAAAYMVMPAVFGIEPGVVPDWAPAR